MPTELDEARDKLIERMAHSLYLLCADASGRAVDFQEEHGYALEANDLDALLTDFIRARRAQ